MFMKRLAEIGAVVLPYSIILCVAILRLATDYPQNFIPIFTCILVFAALRPMRELPIPILFLIGIDALLTTHRYGHSLTADHAVTWSWYLSVALLGGKLLRQSSSIRQGVGATVLAAVTFFVASNFVVWTLWGMYPRSWSGLAQCYIAALPFFRNSLISETVCSVGIFSIMKFAVLRIYPERIQDSSY
jgi:hypothetical protein